jgi:Flp pilus assembly protein TadG
VGRDGGMRGRLVRAESGETLVTLALVLPILIGFVFGIMQVCLLYYTWEMMAESACQGSRYAMVRGSTCETSAAASCTVTAAQVNTYVKGLGWPNLGNGTMTVDTSFPDGDEAPGHRVLVTVTYSFPYQIPFVVTKTLSLSSSSQVYFVQ